MIRSSFKPRIIAALTAGGLTDREIAEHVGCDRSNVTKVRIVLGFAASGRAKILDPGPVHELAALGYSIARISAVFGVSRSCVRAFMVRHGIDRVGKAGRPRKRAGEVSPAGPVGLSTTTHSPLTTETEAHSLSTLTSSE